MKKSFLVLSFFTLALLTSCSSGGNPKEVVVKFFTAIKEKKFDEAKKYATKDSQGLLETISSMQQKVADSSSQQPEKKEQFDVTNVHITGDAATADVVPADKAAALTINLKKEDGQWKVAFDKTSIMKMMMEQAQKEGGNIQKDMGNTIDSLKVEAGKSSSVLDSLSKAADSLKK